MVKVESFELDHTRVLAPYVRLAGVVTDPAGSGAQVSKFDLRFMQPNVAYLDQAGLHSVEHSLAGLLRDHLDGVIDLSPMGCRTGFYVTVFGTPSVKAVRDALVLALTDLLQIEEVPGASELTCGNYREHSLVEAKAIANRVLEAGFSLDPFERVLD